MSKNRLQGREDRFCGRRRSAIWCEVSSVASKPELARILLTSSTANPLIPDLGVGMRWDEPTKARIVLPVERPADDDGVNGGSIAPSAHLLDEALDEIESAGAPAGHGAHCIELIDDQHSVASGVLCGRREDECRVIPRGRGFDQAQGESSTPRAPDRA